MYIFISVNMYAIRRCTHGVPTVYPYPQYPWLTEPEGRQVRVLTGTSTGQPGITWGLPMLISTCFRPCLFLTVSLMYRSAAQIHMRPYNSSCFYRIGVDPRCIQC